MENVSMYHSQQVSVPTLPAVFFEVIVVSGIERILIPYHSMSFHQSILILIISSHFIYVIHQGSGRDNAYCLVARDSADNRIAAQVKKHAAKPPLSSNCWWAAAHCQLHFTVLDVLVIVSAILQKFTAGTEWEGEFMDNIVNCHNRGILYTNNFGSGESSKIISEYKDETFNQVGSVHRMVLLLGTRGSQLPHLPCKMLCSNSCIRLEMRL